MTATLTRMSEQRGRLIVAARAGGRCERCGRPGPLEWSHRLARGQGGGWEPSNGLHLCPGCHRWAHANPEQARAEGVHLRTGADPSTAPVWLSPAQLWPGWWLLDDEGLYIPAEPPAETDPPTEEDAA